MALSRVDPSSFQRSLSGEIVSATAAVGAVGGDTGVVNAAGREPSSATASSLCYTALGASLRVYGSSQTFRSNLSPGYKSFLMEALLPNLLLVAGAWWVCSPAGRREIALAGTLPDSPLSCLLSLPMAFFAPGGGGSLILFPTLLAAMISRENGGTGGRSTASTVHDESATLAPPLDSRCSAQSSVVREILETSMSTAPLVEYLKRAIAGTAAPFEIPSYLSLENRVPAAFWPQLLSALL